VIALVIALAVELQRLEVVSPLHSTGSTATGRRTQTLRGTVRQYFFAILFLLVLVLVVVVD